MPWDEPRGLLRSNKDAKGTRSFNGSKNHDGRPSPVPKYKGNTSVSWPSQVRSPRTRVDLPLPSTPRIATTTPPPGARRFHGRGQCNRRLLSVPMAQHIARPDVRTTASTALYTRYFAMPRRIRRRKAWRSSNGDGSKTASVTTSARSGPNSAVAR